MKGSLERHYNLENNSSWSRARQAFVHLEAFFGAEARATDITKGRVREYQEARLAGGAARNTVRYETGVLSAAFGAAANDEILATVPKFPQLAEGEPSVSRWPL